jgi:asparagine synthase (glutamine-hydrolysing)
MCGLAGYFAPAGLSSEAGRALLERMLGRIRHRGPDDQGIFVSPHCGLGSTRLSIIDLAGGHMPMSDRSGRYTAAQNGELYNHPALRQELEGRGHPFTTRSDTEVLLPLYAELGPALLPKLTGMFAVGIYDAVERRLLLGRDRFGMKPLYYAEVDGLLLFASEVKALLASGRVEAKLDPLALRDLGSAGYPMPPRTMIAGVRSLPPGHRWVLSPEATSRPERWYQVPYPNLEPSPPALSRRGLDAAGEALREVLDQVVADHLLADVEVGSYLSGGLDSVSVAALAKRHAPGLRTFSMTFPANEPRFDESSHSNLAAQAIGTVHQQVLQEPIGHDDYLNTLLALEAPQVHTVGFCLYRLARAVRQAGLKVVLSGEGADEIFAGYSVFKIGKFRRSVFGRNLGLRNTLTRWTLGRRQPELARRLAGWWGREPELSARYGVIPPWVEQWWINAESFQSALAPGARGLWGPAPLSELPEPPPGVELEKVQDNLHKELAFEQASRLDGWVLPLGDRLTMAHGLELRVPFLDHRVVELAARLPSSFLLGWKEKRVLRAAMRGVIPEVLRQRQKRAFVAPVRTWLFGPEAPEFVKDYLSPASLKAGGRFDPDVIQQLWQAQAQGHRSLAALESSWTLHLALGIEAYSRALSLSL